MATAQKILGNGKYSYTFDDIILHPGYIDFPVSDVNLSSHIGNIPLHIPIISSPMDTVTEDTMAIKLALLGGLGIIHRNNTIEEQVELVRSVKQFRNGFITNPLTLAPTNTVGDVIRIKHEKGFTGIPITDTGKIGGLLVGLVTGRDIESCDTNELLSHVMTPRDELITCTTQATLDEVKTMMRRNKKGRIPIVDADDNLVSLVCRRDMRSIIENPEASLDAAERLRCGAAIGTRETDKTRVQALHDQGIDCICIDSSQGNSTYQLDMIQWIRREYPELQIIGGNVVTHAQADNLMRAGVNALRIGMGAGSICTTQTVCAVGRGQMSAIYDVNWARRNHIQRDRVLSLNSIDPNISLIADGGIRNSGDIMKALAAGADTVMLGSLLAGTEETPGEYVYKGGRQQKCYRGMGSIEVLSKGNPECSDRYLHNNKAIPVAQGVSGFVLNKGSITKHIPYICQGIRHGFQDLGVKTISDLHNEVHNKQNIRLSMRTASAIREGGIHDLILE